MFLPCERYSPLPTSTENPPVCHLTSSYLQARDAITANQFLPYGADKEWGRTDELHDMRQHDLIPVTIDKEMGGHRHSIPRKVRLELKLKYFQMTKGKKRLVEARAFYSEKCTTQQPGQFGGSTTILDMMQERGILPCDVDTINGGRATDHSTHKSSCQDIVVPHQDDGLSVLWSVAVCWFGSWMGSGNGAT